MKESNQIEKINMFDGYLISDDERVSEFIEALLDKGIIWEYLSALLKQEVLNKGTPSLPNLNPSPPIDSVRIVEENAQIKEQLNNVMKQLGDLAGLIKAGNVSVNTQSVNDVVIKKEEVKKEMPQMVVKKAPPKKGAKGGLARGAKRMAALTKNRQN